MNILEALAQLTSYAEVAQTSGVVPVGGWNLALSVLIIGSHAVQTSGALQPREPVEISEIGQNFDAAVARMRAALAAAPGGA